MKKSLFLAVLAMAFMACTPSGNEPSKPSGTPSYQMHKSPKRGTCFNFNNSLDLPLLSPSISWYYNWGNTANATASAWFDAEGTDFCPMCWNGTYSKDNIRQYVAAHPNTKYLLAFNEPNLTDQANMTPSAAAALWPDVVALAKELNLKLVSPAMNYGTLAGYSDPIKWLDEFFAQPGVSIDDVDAISIHCYMGSAGALESFCERFEKYGKPVWLTEFCAWESNISKVENQMDYMVAALNYLEQSPLIERYAWFMPRVNGSVNNYPYMQLLTHDNPPELTSLGKIYTEFSTFDKSVYLDLSRPVYAIKYVGLRKNTIIIRPCSEDAEQLMVSTVMQDDWFDYQVYTEENLTSLRLRYATAVKSRAVIEVDGKEGIEFEVPATGTTMDTWATIDAPVKMKAGAHTIRVKVVSGGFNFEYIVG